MQKKRRQVQKSLRYIIIFITNNNMNSLRFDVIYMLITGFILQYYVKSMIATNSFDNVHNSLGKAYISAIMAIIMSILEVIMYDFSHKMLTITYSYYIPLFTALITFIWLYRTQIGVNDKQYLNEMIEHHSMALLTSEQILEKTKNPQVKNLANKIINTQKREIQQMNKML